MLNCFVHHFFVAVDGEVIALGGDIGLGYAETLSGAGVLLFAGVSQAPACQDIRQVVLR